MKPQGQLQHCLKQEVANIFISWIKRKERKKKMSLSIEIAVENLLHAGLNTDFFFLTHYLI